MEEPDRTFTELLRKLYQEQLKTVPGDEYLRFHGEAEFVRGCVRVFRFYERFLPSGGRILDWGCRHAPDACMIRKKFGDGAQIDGCDVIGVDQYRIFFEYSGLRYELLRDAWALPYPNACFDAVVASGVLEHVPIDYESLKELYRVLKPGGRLILTYLPNRWSVEEWWLRFNRRPNSHRRLYSLSESRRMLLHSGFVPVLAGFQTQLDLLPGDGNGSAIWRSILRLAMLQRLTSCICAVAEKSSYL